MTGLERGAPSPELVGKSVEGRRGRRGLKSLREILLYGLQRGPVGGLFGKAPGRLVGGTSVGGAGRNVRLNLDDNRATAQWGMVVSHRVPHRTVEDDLEHK